MPLSSTEASQQHRPVIGSRLILLCEQFPYSLSEYRVHYFCAEFNADLRTASVSQLKTKKCKSNWNLQKKLHIEDKTLHSAIIYFFYIT